MYTKTFGFCLTGLLLTSYSRLGRVTNGEPRIVAADFLHAEYPPTTTSQNISQPTYCNVTKHWSMQAVSLETKHRNRFKNKCKHLQFQKQFFSIVGIQRPCKYHLLFKHGADLPTLLVQWISRNVESFWQKVNNLGFHAQLHSSSTCNIFTTDGNFFHF